MVTYELAQSILIHVLIEGAEKLSLDQELVSYTHICKIMWVLCGAIYVISYVLKVDTTREIILEPGCLKREHKMISNNIIPTKFMLLFNVNCFLSFRISYI
jgi:hypothetical protein